MRVKVQIDDGEEILVAIVRDLFDEEGQVTDAVLYPSAVSQAIVTLRAAILAAYGYDLPEVWEPIIDAIP